MIELPLHTLPKNLDLEFNEYLTKYNIPKNIFLVILDDLQYLFIYKEKAEIFLSNSNAIEVSKLPIDEVVFQKKILLEPCLSCDFKGYSVGDSEELKLYVSTAEFLEEYYLTASKKMFDDGKTDELYIISKDVLEHYNPSSSIAHFYLGFCFYCFGDTENYDTALKNLQKRDMALAEKLQELNNTPKT